MKTLHKTTIVAISLLMITANMFVQFVQAESTETSAKENLKSFLFDVVGLDLTKYNITKSGYGISYPSNLGGIVKEETVSYTFDSGQSKADSWCTFDNGIMTSCSLTLTEGSAIYVQTRSANLVEETGNIIQRYQIFANQHNTKDTEYLKTAQTILGEATTQRLSTLISDNMKIDISPSSESTSIKWTYSTKGIDMPFKSIVLKFRDDDFCWFGDGWSLYTAKEFEAISKEEAATLGFATAKNYTVHLLKFDGNNVTSIEARPEWTKMTYEGGLEMLPGATLNMSLPAIPSAPNIPSYIIPSNTIRDPLTLYPMWRLVFYFDKPIGSISGIQLGIWADTKEIAYCSEYGSLGSSGDSSKTRVGQSVSDGTQGTSFISLKPEYVYVTVLLFAIATTLGSYLVAKRRRNQQ